MNPATRLFYFGYNHPSMRRIIGRILRIVFSCDCGFPIKMGEGIFLEHNALGVVVSREVALGSNVKIYHHVTLWAGNGGYPTIGSNVIIYSGATVCGKIKIGNNVIIGANSFVNKSFPDNVVIAGVPAKIIKKLDEKDLYNNHS